MAGLMKTCKGESKSSCLEFTSEFECGNLRKAIKRNESNCYDLILNVDTNTNRHAQWFNFKVSNGKKGETYSAFKNWVRLPEIGYF